MIDDAVFNEAVDVGAVFRNGPHEVLIHLELYAYLVLFHIGAFAKYKRFFDWRGWIGKR
jgi:hypothetical protein